ncbi:hypothetical protein Pmani_029463 [Petrolisthes manimaculis]|uniref:Uncharacterized protein n=1 Tax=Petrolisthes manimaculis TaxID=1843537 RepID=A0AAE1NZI6_9EUCA|nr:hypothetical protein Pmani_029463 [Petrolisthes manimaculis]
MQENLRGSMIIYSLQPTRCCRIQKNNNNNLDATSGSSTSLGLILTQCYQHGVTVSRVAGGSVGSTGLCTSTSQGGWSLPLPRR